MTVRRAAIIGVPALAAAGLAAATIHDNREGTANITRKGSSFTFDTQWCRGGPVPH